MENLENLTDEFYNKEILRVQAFKRYSKYQKIVEKLKPAENCEYEPSKSELALWGGAFTILNGMLGLILCEAFKRSFISHYLSKPENAEKLQELYSQTGFDSIRELSSYLMGNDGVARVLFENCGAREYFLHNAVGIGGAFAVLGCAYVCAPPAYKKIKSRRYESACKKLAEAEAEYTKLNKDCEYLQTKIKDTVYKSWTEDNHWRDSSSATHDGFERN